MLVLGPDVKIYLSTEVADMRKAINGLSVLVLDVIKENPQSGHVFVFFNKAKNKVKCLCWDRNGFILHYKRLERGRFKVSQGSDGTIELSHDQLSWLLVGLDFMLMDTFSDLNYAHYY
ncbi:MAG TPA: IS66 family insertion sequence element accessory protein TnpB [Gammaproteobacteria bacterium]|nr:IS66 family insertion sequence element accessory protein TnpB [Gammaproteobacteria bacterium]